MIDDTLLLTVCGIGASLLLTIAFGIWKRSKGKTSIFAQDDTLEDVGLSVLSAAFPSRATTEDFRTVLRPPWGLRIGGPILAALMLIYVDLTPLTESLGWALPEGPRLFKLGIGAVLAYTTAMLLFVQRVAYDRREIRSYGMDPRAQTRQLSGLTGIEMHPNRPALVLSFADQPHLYIPKYLSDRETFIAEMRAIAAQNALAAPDHHQSLRYRMGL